MRTLICLCLFIGSVHAAGFSDPIFPEAKITVRVLNIGGQPVTNANVSIGFGQGGDAWIGEHKSESFEGTTDSNGCFSAQAKCYGNIGGSVSKAGCYSSLFRHDYPGTYQGKKRWDPWNPIIEVVLKQIEKPVPMYVKPVQTKLPIVDKIVGFDLEKGDWVSPHGEGLTSDLIFQVKGYFNDFRDHDLMLTLLFPNKGDGIQSFDVSPTPTTRSGSMFRSTHFAPAEGYKPQWTWESRRMRDPNDPKEKDKVSVNTYDENKNYYFRVRTVLDENGKIVKALYGKIYGDIRFGGSDKGYLWMKDFVYYFNPTPNDRNLEYDPEKNLFGGNDRFAP